jgi:hypothetical protein
MTHQKRLIIFPVTPEEITLYSKGGYSICEVINRKGTDYQLRHELNTRGNIDVLVIDENNNNRGHSEEELKREQIRKPYAAMNRLYEDKSPPSIILCNQIELSEFLESHIIRNQREDGLSFAFARASLTDYILLLREKHLRLSDR